MNKFVNLQINLKNYGKETDTDRKYDQSKGEKQ